MAKRFKRYNSKQKTIEVMFGGMTPATTSINRNSKWVVLSTNNNYPDRTLLHCRPAAEGEKHDVKIISSKFAVVHKQQLRITWPLKYNSSGALCVWVKTQTPK